MTDSLATEYALAMDALRASARVLERTRDEGGVVVHSLSGRDVKISTDRESEERILATLEPFGLPVVAEESRAEAALPEGRAWVVDPLDGSANFLRGVPLYCVAIALIESGRPTMGVIFDPSRGHVFSGIEGQGAWVGSLDNPRMHVIEVSDVTARKDAILATGLPVSRDFSPGALAGFLPWFADFKKVRMFGTAGLSLALVAAGTVDAYAEDAILIWDVAAGIALVRSAGGHVTMTPSVNGPRHAYDVRAGASELLWSAGHEDGGMSE